MTDTTKFTTRRLRGKNARLAPLPLEAIGNEPAPPPATASIDIAAGETAEYAFRVAFATTPGDPSGRGHIDDLAKALRANGFTVRDISLVIDAKTLMTPQEVARRDELHRRAAAMHERSIKSRRAVDALTTRSPSPGSTPPPRSA